MNFRAKLSSRIGMNDIHEITNLMQGDNKRKKELYNLLFDKDDSVAYSVAWVMTHFSLHENIWLYSKQDELIDEALACQHVGKRRLILSLLYRQPLANPPRVDFLDFCLERMISQKEPVAVQSICIKLAYELCLSIPELLQELREMLDMMESSLLTPATNVARKNVLKAMKSGKSLQIY